MKLSQLAGKEFIAFFCMRFIWGANQAVLGDDESDRKFPIRSILCEGQHPFYRLEADRTRVDRRPVRSLKIDIKAVHPRLDISVSNSLIFQVLMEFGQELVPVIGTERMDQKWKFGDAAFQSRFIP